MAASNASGVLLKAEETKEIKIPNFSRLHAGYVEGGLHLQDAALTTIVVRVFPCGRKYSKTKDYVSVLFRKQWLRNFPLNFHCTISVLDIDGDRNYTQTCGMEELERDFEIDIFVRRSTLFKNDLALLPNDTLTVLCEVTYTMASSKRNSKIWSVLNRLYAWCPHKRDDFCGSQEDEDMLSLVVETMDGGEFLIPTLSSYFSVETNAVAESLGEEFSKIVEESGKSKEIPESVSPGSTRSENLLSMDTTSTFSLTRNIQTASLESAFKKNSKTCDDKKDITSILSGINLANGKKDKSGFISAITEVLSNANLLPDNTSKSAITKGSTLCPSNSKEKTPFAFNAKTLFETDFKNKTLSEIAVKDLAKSSNNRIRDDERNISNTGVEVKKVKPKLKEVAALNTKILDLGSRKTVKGSDICAASPVFTSMLKTPMLENANKRVKLQNIDADTFDNFLYYLETREIIAEKFEKLCALYEMADQYEIMDLMVDCAQHLATSLNVQNFFNILKLADMHSDDTLKKKIYKFFLQNEKTILSSFKHDPDFLMWYGSWKKEDISSNIDTSDDEIEACDNDLNFYR